MKHSPLPCYGVAVLAVALALLLKLLLGPLITQETPFLLFFAAVMVSAWYGGLGPGVLATALGALGAGFFLSSTEPFLGTSSVAAPLGLFLLEGALISALVAALRSAKSGAEDSALRAQSHQSDLRRSEERFRATFEQAAVGIAHVGTDGRWLRVNQKFCDIAGYAHEELLEHTFQEITHPDDLDADLEYVRQLLAGEIEDYSMEKRYVKKDGSIVWINLTVSLVRSPSGDPEYFISAVEDITESKRARESLQRSLASLLALHEASRIFGSTLEMGEIGRRLLEIAQGVSGSEAAVIHLRDKRGRMRALHAVGPEDLWRSARGGPEARAARHAALETGRRQLFRTRRSYPEKEAPRGVCLPLKVGDRVIGVLEAYGPEALLEKATVELLGSLAGQATSALENARLYEELDGRKRQLQDLVGKLLAAQEEERRRVAYEVHDGLTQTAFSAHQHLQAFASYHPPGSAEGREELGRVLELVGQTVEEARQVIADLRPTELDDFGLAAAIRSQAEQLRAEGWQVGYEETLGDERLPVAMETALYRVAQQALSNVRKHACSTRVRLELERPGRSVRLVIRDWGRGFDPTAPANGGGPGERVGLAGMRERVALLGGEFEVRSRPGTGTLVAATIPLPEPGEEDDESNR